MLLSLVQHTPDPPSRSGRDFRLLSDEREGTPGNRKSGGGTPPPPDSRKREKGPVAAGSQGEIPLTTGSQEKGPLTVRSQKGNGPLINMNLYLLASIFQKPLNKNIILPREFIDTTII